MARQLWLLRHAEAEPHGTRPDAQRRLTERGERQARIAGIAIARLGAAFDEVLYSPKERAAKTAQLAGEAWGAQQRGVLREYGPLASGLDAAAALEALARTAGGHERLLLIGHEPDLSQTAGELAGGQLDLKKGGLAVVRLESPAHAARGELAILMRPRELALIAGLPLDDD
jgi:phosphohistidine phosphatase